MAIPNNKTAIEILMEIEKSGFQSEIWTRELMNQYKKNLGFEQLLRPKRPKRSAGAQLLRDAALGHPEYPEDEK